MLNRRTLLGGGAGLAAAALVGTAAVAAPKERCPTPTKIQRCGTPTASPTPTVVGPDPFLDIDFDDSETQALTHPGSAFVYNSAHQKAWVTNRTRLGTGHAERFEVHNNVNDRYNGGTERFRARMRVMGTNDGGISTATATGYLEVFWCMSFYLPSSGSGDPDATISVGFPQVQGPDYEHLMTTTDQSQADFPSGAGSDVGSTHAFLIRDGDFEFRQRCGEVVWTGAVYDMPNWRDCRSFGNVPGVTGSNDRIKVPITGQADSVFPMDTWVDIIMHIKYATDSTGLCEIWARRAGQAFAASANISWNGPTVLWVDPAQDGLRYTTQDQASAYADVCGTYLQLGWYTGSDIWSDTTNGAHVMFADEGRRWGTLAQAKANWG